MMSKIDPVLILLFLGIVIFTAILIATDVVFKGEGQIFQVLSSLVAGFSGAFFARMKPEDSHKNPLPPVPTDATVDKTQS